MLSTIKMYFSKDARFPDLSENLGKFNDCIEKIRFTISKEDFNNLSFYVDLGNFLARERDNHYYIFMRDSKSIRDLFIELGKRLKEQGLLHDERDFFFLFIQEVFDLFSLGVQISDKQVITSKIPNRMNAFTHVSGFKLHERPGYSPEIAPIRDDEFY